MLHARKRRGKQNAEGSCNTLHRWAFDLHLAGGLQLGFEPGFSKNRFADKSAGCELHHISSERSPLRTSFRGPVSAAGGTRYFEPDGVIFLGGGREPALDFSAAYPQPRKRKSGLFNRDLLRINSQATEEILAWRVHRRFSRQKG